VSDRDARLQHEWKVLEAEPALQPALARIRARLRNAPNRKEAADLAGVSAKTIDRVVTRRIGRTYSAWRYEVRAVVSARTFDRGELALDEVATQGGWRDRSGLYRALRARLGRSPTRRHRKENSGRDSPPPQGARDAARIRGSLPPLSTFAPFGHSTASATSLPCARRSGVDRSMPTVRPATRCAVLDDRASRDSSRSSDGSTTSRISTPLRTGGAPR
jgi:AraC-like DNA-binding protein